MFGTKITPWALFRTDPYKQVRNTVRKFPITSLLSSCFFLGISVFGKLPLLIEIPIFLISATHLLKFGLEYQRLFKNMKHREYFKQKKITIDTQVVAEIELYRDSSYDNPYPILVMHTNEPFKVGQAIARAVHVPFLAMIERYYNLLQIKILFQCFIKENKQWPFGQFSHQRQLQFTIHYSSKYQEQLGGFVEEINYWILQHNKKYIFGFNPLTMMDVINLSYCIDEMKLLSSTTGICNKLLFRNLNWNTLNSLTHIAINFLNTSSKKEYPARILSIGFVPGYINMTVCNKELVAIMDDAATTTTQRFLNRGSHKFHYIFNYIGRKCRSITDVENLLNDRFSKHKPSSTHTLTVWEPKTGKRCIFQILPPGREETYLMREIEPHANFLGVTNHHIDQEGKIIEGSQINANSFIRYRELMKNMIPTNGYSILNAIRQKDTIQEMIFSSSPYQCRLRHGQSNKTLSAPVTLPIKKLLKVTNSS